MHVCDIVLTDLMQMDLPLARLNFAAAMPLRGTPGRLTKFAMRKRGLLLLRIRQKFILKFGWIPRALTYKAIAKRIGVY